MAPEDLGFVTEHPCGIKVGDRVAVEDYDGPGTIKERTVIRIWRDQCEGGYMLGLREPLKNRTKNISIAWTREFKAWKATQ